MEVAVRRPSKVLVGVIVLLSLALAFFVGKSMGVDTPNPIPQQFTPQQIQEIAAKSTVFLQADGVTGPDDAVNHAQHAPVQSFSWGMSKNITTGGGGGGQVPKTSFSDVSVSRAPDTYSPVFADKLDAATQYAHVRLYIVATSKTPAITIHMRDVFATSFQTGGSAAGASDSMSFTYERIEYTVSGVTTGDLIVT